MKGESRRFVEKMEDSKQYTNSMTPCYDLGSSAIANLVIIKVAANYHQSLAIEYSQISNELDRLILAVTAAISNKEFPQQLLKDSPSYLPDALGICQDDFSKDYIGLIDVGTPLEEDQSDWELVLRFRMNRAYISSCLSVIDVISLLGFHENVADGKDEESISLIARNFEELLQSLVPFGRGWHPWLDCGLAEIIYVTWVLEFLKISVPQNQKMFTGWRKRLITALDSEVVRYPHN